MTTTDLGAGLAARIRRSSAAAHREVEGVAFVQDLMAGRLPVQGYVRLAVQHEAVYRVLEAAVAANDDPVLAPFLAPELARVPALEADLAFLAGEGWRDRVPVLAATDAYCDRVRRAATAGPGGLLAHHYVRYLGDLSGGQVIGRVLARVYRFADERGTSFYRFPAIPSPKAHKVRYRQLLDALPWGERDRQRLIDEVDVAYRCNAAVLRALGDDGGEDRLR